MYRQQSACDRSGSGFVDSLHCGEIDAAAGDQATIVQRHILSGIERQSTRRALNIRIHQNVAGPTCRYQIDCPAATGCHTRTDGFRATRKQKDITICRCRDCTRRRKRSGVRHRDVTTGLCDPCDVQRQAVDKADVAGRCVRCIETCHHVRVIESCP